MNNESKFNILRGIVLSSFLDIETKKELLDFIRRLEERQADNG